MRHATGLVSRSWKRSYRVWRRRFRLLTALIERVTPWKIGRNPYFVKVKFRRSILWYSDASFGRFWLWKWPLLLAWKRGWEGTKNGRENRCNSPSPEVQYPKPEYEKEPFWTGGGSGCRTWSRRAFWPHVWPQTAPEYSETVELRGAESAPKRAETTGNFRKRTEKI